LLKGNSLENFDCQEKKYSIANMLEFGDKRETVVELTVEGFRKEDIDIRIDGKSIIITGEAEKEFSEDYVYLFKQTSNKTFKRVLTLYEEVERVFAEMNGDVLKMRIVSKISNLKRTK
jgi:HSP20 family molecular chaperone IbpA